MRRAWLIACSVVVACQEPSSTTPVAPDEPAAPGPGSELAVEPGVPPEPEAEAAGPLQLQIDDDRVLRGSDALATLRGPDAPGRVDSEYRAVYDHPALRQALAELPAATLEVTTSTQTPVGAVRQVWTSVVDPGSSATLRITGRDPLALSRPGAPGSMPTLRPRGRGWSLYEAGVATASADDLGGLAAPLAATEGSSIGVDVLDAAAVTVLADGIAAVQKAGKTAALSLAFDPCTPAPEGMVCVPGGPAIVGYDDGLPEEKPERELVLSTYYVDRYEVTNAQYDACHEAGACKLRINQTQNIMKPFVGDDQPAMPMDWHRARSYCAWAGKRLPTEWEWEKAARGPDGELFPWGDEEPSCEASVFRECAPFGCKPYPGKTHRWDCNEHATKPVGSFPAGHYGIFDMAGNGYEWTASAGIERIEDCGEACEGLDPQGPCDGAFPCRGQRILRGGSWYWPKHRTRGSHRRLEKLKTGSHRLGMRCATENPFLTTYPPMHLGESRDSLPVPEPPTADQLAVFAAVDDDPIEDKPICSAKVREAWGEAQARGGRSETTCRDPFPYLMSNEPRSFHWNDYVENVGGTYVGIGSDQNYSTIAAARARWAWVVDYDPRVVRNHRRVLALIAAADTPDAFVEFFAPSHKAAALKVLDEAFADSPDRKRMRAGFLATRDELHAYFIKQRKSDPKAGTYGWLRQDDNYAYIRELVTQGRLRAVAGDLLRGDGALAKIGDTARALNSPVRVYYTSNAPSSWGGMVTAEYRSNVTGLPFDRLSLVLQTNSRGGFKQTGHWHHSVSWGPFHQRRLQRPGYDSIPKLLEGKIPGHHGDVTVLGIPTAAP